METQARTAGYTQLMLTRCQDYLSHGIVHLVTKSAMPAHACLIHRRCVCTQRPCTEIMQGSFHVKNIHVSIHSTDTYTSCTGCVSKSWHAAAVHHIHAKNMTNLSWRERMTAGLCTPCPVCCDAKLVMCVVQHASKGVCGPLQRTAHLQRAVHANLTLPNFCSGRLQVLVDLNALDCILQFQSIDIHTDEQLIEPEMETTVACASSNSDSTMHMTAWSTHL